MSPADDAGTTPEKSPVDKMFSDLAKHLEKAVPTSAQGTNPDHPPLKDGLKVGYLIPGLPEKEMVAYTGLHVTLAMKHLMGAFHWKNTDPGKEYWAGVVHNLSKIAEAMKTRLEELGGGK